ncbi:MAG: hypothetical protein WBA07_33570 [Rivularia sp. (in: cyanobacteria)]
MAKNTMVISGAFPQKDSKCSDVDLRTSRLPLRYGLTANSDCEIYIFSA